MLKLINDIALKNSMGVTIEKIDSDHYVLNFLSGAGFISDRMVAHSEGEVIEKIKENIQYYLTTPDLEIPDNNIKYWEKELEKKEPK